MPSMKDPMAERDDSGAEEFSGDENTPLTENIYGGSQRSIQETKGWDVFQIKPRDTNTHSLANQKCVEFTVKVLKVFAYLLTFTIVLCCGVITKGTLFLMTSQIRQNRKVEYCNKNFARDKHYEAQIPEAERIVWIWCLLLAFLLPEFGTLFRSTRICLFKSWKRPTVSDFSIVFMFETMHTIGLAMLVFLVLPELDVVKCAMLTNCVCFIPGVFGLLSRNSKESNRILKVIMDMIAISSQATGFVIWPIIEWQNGNTKVWAIPFAIFLISSGWWENYVDRHSSVGFIKYLGKIKERLNGKNKERKERLKGTRYFTYMFISLWKIILFFSTMLIILYFNQQSISNLFLKFTEGFSPHILNVTEVHSTITNNVVPDISTVAPLQEIFPEISWHNTPVYVCLIHILSAWLTYVFAKFACKICIQGFSFAFPVNLTIPVAISLLIAACGLHNEDSCIFMNTMPDYLYWECPHGDFLNGFISDQHAWIWLLWLLSQTWITLHIWTPKCERLAATEKLFVTPMYTSFLIDQSLSLNRRRDDEGEVKTEDIDLDRDTCENSQYYETISVHSVHTDSSSSPNKSAKSSDHLTRIYACATMWHETKVEVMDMLKSLFRLDEDQSARRVAQKYLKIVDPDYYEFEIHIFFDDAFEISDDNENENVVNRFVKQLIDTMDEAASAVHMINIRIRPPKKYPTPYGGRLVWTLPGKTKIVCHLKDKSKIRHKKRWSQCMYMYYLLGHRLMDLPISADRKTTLAENTYLLTLDGDIEFQPIAVKLLVDLMKKNKNLGAACGRIHPVGSGPMVWYQKFEYAIGHWLQKATEHMIGCVLCSPGCFSLFRGQALMDDNVMRRYMTTSEEPRHYVQYDQGEDRWLCTLLLQRGYRVEYSAASDAYTHCPEGFNEFYNQRRRWVPSTIANIMDLLMDFKQTIKINDNISFPYICYQTMLMGGTILGPGTIFLMLVGAFVAAFRIDNWTSFYYNIIPILLFIIICFTVNSKMQIAIAQILSTLYALVMMAVIVGTALQLGEDGIGSPSAIFLITLSMSFFIAALIHPQEFWCVVPGLLYLLAIPSMYLLLIMYSIINLNVVSWGTREVLTKKTKKELEQERKEAEEEKKKARKKGMLGFLQQSSPVGEEGSLEFSFANLFRCMFCTYQKPVDEKMQMLRIADSLDSLAKRLDHIERVIDPHSAHGLRRKSTSRNSVIHGLSGDPLASQKEKEEDVIDEESEVESETLEPSQERDDLINPYWVEDKGLKRGEVEYLSGPEIQFWKDLIEKYLHPIDKDKAKEERMVAELKQLRNKASFAFFMFNALFILIVFLLQLNKDNLHVDWPLGVKTNITYIEETSEVIISKEYLQLEPIGLVFVFFFALILIIQFVAMLFHRFGTISHILAATDLTCCTKKNEELSQDAIINKNGVELARQMQRLRDIDDECNSDSGSSSDKVTHRRTVYHLEKNRQKKRAIGTLDVAFKKRFFSITAEEGAEGTPVKNNMRNIPMHRETLKALEVRRNTVMGERKNSRMQTLGANNPYGKNQGRHRNSVAMLNGTVERVFTPNGGVTNNGFDGSSEEDAGSVRNPLPGRNNVSWKDPDAVRRGSQLLNN